MKFQYRLIWIIIIEILIFGRRFSSLLLLSSSSSFLLLQCHIVLRVHRSWTESNPTAYVVHVKCHCFRVLSVFCFCHFCFVCFHWWAIALFTSLVFPLIRKCVRRAGISQFALCRTKMFMFHLMHCCVPKMLRDLGIFHIFRLGITEMCENDNEFLCYSILLLKLTQAKWFIVLVRTKNCGGNEVPEKYNLWACHCDGSVVEESRESNPNFVDAKQTENFSANMAIDKQPQNSTKSRARNQRESVSRETKQKKIFFFWFILAALPGNQTQSVRNAK